MAKAPVVEEAQMRHAIKVATVTGQTPARDAALLCVLYGTGMTATELAQLEVADVLAESGAFRSASEIRASIAFNGRRRPIFWTNTRVRDALDAYLTERVRLRQGVTAWRSQWRGNSFSRLWHSRPYGRCAPARAALPLWRAAPSCGLRHQEPSGR